MKFGIQLFGILKDRRSDTMDALRSLAGLIPRTEGNEKLLQTQELFVCCHGWSGSFVAGSPYAFSDALTARMTASLTTSAAREPTRSRSARVLFLPGTVIMIPDAPGFSNRTQVTTDTGIPYI